MGGAASSFLPVVTWSGHSIGQLRLLLHPERGFGCALLLWMEINLFDAASKASSCVCASLSLPCPVHRPVVAMGRACRSITSFVARPLVVPWFELWRSGVLSWSPVRLTLRQLRSSRSSSTRSRWLLSGFLPPTAGRSFIGGTSACYGPLLRVTGISLVFGLATAVFRCGGGFTCGY